MARLGISGITVSTVGQVIAEAYDVGQLCTSDNINVWSRFKPYKSGHVSATTVTQMEANLSGTAIHWAVQWVRPTGCSANTDCTYGGVITKITNNAIDGTLPYVQHVKPTGGAASPYRLGDFRKYYHDAVPPIRPSAYNETKVRNVGTTTSPVYGISCQFDVTPEGATYENGSLRLSEIYLNNNTYKFSDMYFGVILFKDATHYYVMTQANKYNNDSAWDVLGITLTGLTNTDFSTTGSDWYLLPFFSTQPQTTILRNSAGSTAFQNAAKLPLSYGLTKYSITAYKASEQESYYVNGGSVVMFTDNATYNNKLYYTVILRNNTSTAYTGTFVLKCTAEDTPSLNQNLTMLSTSVKVNAKSSYTPTTTYECGLAEITIPTTGYTKAAFINSVKNGHVKFTMTWGGKEYTGTVIDGQGGKPTDP